MANKQSRASRDSTIHIEGNVTDSAIHIGDTIKTGYTSEEVTALIEQITSTFQPKPFNGTCPYKGLDVFEEEDTELFFGREKLVEELVRRVGESRTVFITGPSGSGKSSLVRAGLIPALKKGSLKDSDRWLYATMKPGRNPLEALGRAVSHLAGTTNAEDEIRAKGLKDASIFARWCEILLKDGRERRFVLFVDQFEEVFTQVNHEGERQAFLNLLTYAAGDENGRVILLFSMRSDFVPNCAVYPELNATLNRQFIQIGAMQPDELVSAIAQPALRVGLKIEPELIAQIINDMKGEPGALPLMSFALKDLFEKEQAKSGMIALTLSDYLENKGINEALQRHADAALAQFNDHEKKLAQSIFSGLIEIGRGTQDTKRTALFEELVPADTKSDEVKAVVQKLSDARLVTTEEGSDKYTITHEKLIDAWPWLKKLINENRDAITLQNEIADAAKEWEENKRDASYLYSGGRLANIWEQVQNQKLALGQSAQEFVKAGRRREQRTRVALISAVSLVLIAAIVASVVFQNQAKIARDNAYIAATAQYDARIEKQKAEEQKNIALARQLASQAQTIYATTNSKQLTASLLAVESLRLFPNAEASSFLINNNLSALSTGRMTHDGFVYSAAFSPDGKYVASGSGDGTVRVWEAATGDELARMTHNDTVSSVAFSSDGKYVVSGSEDGTARVWEAPTGIELARMTHDGFVYSVAFNPDGKYVVSGSEDGTARVWEAATGEELSHITHDGTVSSVAFSPDGKYIVSGGWDNIARVWEASTGIELARMTHDSFVYSVAFSPDGKYIVSGSDDGAARVWEAATGAELARMTHNGFVQSVAFSPDGKYVVSGSVDGTARVWEAATGNEISHITHDGTVSSVAFSPDGKYIVSGGWDNIARVWETATGIELARMTHEDTVSSVAFNSDGKYVVSGSWDDSARVWEAEAGIEPARMTLNGIVYSVAFSPDGKFIATSSEDHTVRIWDTGTGAELTRMSHDGSVSSIAISPDGKYIASGGDDRTVRIRETATGAEFIRMTHDGSVSSVAFSTDGKYIVSGSGDGTARIWETATGKELTRMTRDDIVSSVAFSPDGKYVATGSYDYTVRIWDITTGNELIRMNHDGTVSSVAFSPDGKYVVSGSEDGTARVWEAASGNEIIRMAQDSIVSSVAFSPDGKYVVSGLFDGTARVWEAASGKELSHITHDGSVRSVAFSSDGKYVVSGSADGTARVWMWKPEDLLATACFRVTRNLTRAEWDQYIGDALPYQAVCDNLPIEPEDTALPTTTP